MKSSSRELARRRQSDGLVLWAAKSTGILTIVKRKVKRVKYIDVKSVIRGQEYSRTSISGNLLSEIR
jgi:hypothetical protein